MIASDMLPPSSSLMLSTPRSTTNTIAHSYYHYDCSLTMDDALHYLRSRSTTETGLPRVPPLPLYRGNAYFPPSESALFAPRRRPYTREYSAASLNVSQTSKINKRVNIYRARATCLSRVAKKIKKGNATRGLPRRSPILVLLSPKHA